MSLRKNALVLAFLTALIAIIGAWSGDESLAGAWRLPLALLLLGLAYEGWMATKARLHLTLSSQQHAILGRTTAVNISVGHELARSATVQIAPDAPEAVEIDTQVQSVLVPQGQEGELSIRATPRRLGQHRWPSLRARIAGPLGLAWCWRRLDAGFTLHVVPDLLRDDARRTGATGVGLRVKATQGSGAEVLQLREYRPGDPQHVIDWKATARSGRLVSRDFSEDQHLDIIIVLDAGRASGVRAGQLDRLGHYANLSARFTEHAIAQDDRVGLVIFADRPLAAIAPGRGVATVLRIRQTLAAAKLVQAESNPLNAALRVRSLARHRSLIIMLTDLDDATVAGQLAAATRLLLPKHLPLIAGLSSPEAQTLGASPARSWLDPYESLAAQEYCARLERNAGALRALGAPTLLTRPEQLERAVFDAYADFRRRRRV